MFLRWRAGVAGAPLVVAAVSRARESLSDREAARAEDFRRCGPRETVSSKVNILEPFSVENKLEIHQIVLCNGLVKPTSSNMFYLCGIGSSKPNDSDRHKFDFEPDRT